MKIILNTLPAKKIGGGGFQISMNFLLKTLESDYGDIQWYYFTSADLDEVVGPRFKDSLNKNYFVFPTQPDIRTYLGVQTRVFKLEKEIKPDLVFSILAPSYLFFKTQEVMRCCNAWDLIPGSHVAYQTLECKTRIKYSIRSILVKALMKRSRYFITQTSTAKDGIARLMHLPKDNIKVISNVLPMVFHEAETATIPHDHLNIVYVAAPFPHKDIRIIPHVAFVLKKKYKIENVRFLLTIPFDDKKTLSLLEETARKLDVEEMLVNKGRMKQVDLAELYRESDIGFFPSLLETFSATLLEYMKFSLPIVASDFAFNKDVAAEAALYFTPSNPDSAADCIAELVLNQDHRTMLSEKSKDRVSLYDNFDRYYENTAAFLLSVTRQE